MQFPPRHPRDPNRYTIPDQLRPVLQRTAVEVLCWGVRNMQRYMLFPVTSPSAEFDVGGQVRASTVIKNSKRNPNFDTPLLFFDVVCSMVLALGCWGCWGWLVTLGVLGC